MHQLPNILTLLRIGLLFPLMGLFFVDTMWARWAILGLFIISALTDYFDGYFARTLKATSEFGTLFDPIADKLLVIALLSLLLAFNLISDIHIIAAILIMLRETFVSGLREYAIGRQIKLPVSQLSKIKTAFQMATLTIYLFTNASDIEIGIIPETILWISTVLSLLTGILHFNALVEHQHDTKETH